MEKNIPEVFLLWCLGKMSTNKDKDTAGLDFLDFIFTIAMSIGLTPELLGNEKIKGLLSEEWAINAQCPSDFFNLGVFFLGFFNLTLSWFGYHGSIIKNPLTYGTIPGMVRFIIDVLLVIIYGVILIYFRFFKTVLFLLSLVYLLYVVWDLFKIKEHKEKYSLSGHSCVDIIKCYRREFVSGFWFIMFFALFVVYFGCGLALSDLGKWSALLAAILFTILYRVNKIIPLWEQLFGVRN